MPQKNSKKINGSLINYEGRNSEIVATYILKELGYTIIFSRGLENRKMVLGMKYQPTDEKIRLTYKKSVGAPQKPNWKVQADLKWRNECQKKYPKMIFFRNIENFLIGDVLCKKDGKNYLFDAKMKFFQENKNMNKFSVTDREVINYNQLTQSRKIPVKILVNLKKDDGYYYGIFDWSEFTYSKNYDPHKSYSTTIRLKNGLDISKLTKFKNIKNYKIEKYLDYSKIKSSQIFRKQYHYSCI